MDEVTLFFTIMASAAALFILMGLVVWIAMSKRNERIMREIEAMPDDE
jgi:hypothetical protein